MSRIGWPLVPVAKPTPQARDPKPLVSKPRPVNAKAKRETFERDSFICGWCRVPGGAVDAHHVIRRSQGGKDEAANLKTVHRQCHRYIHEHPLEAKARGFLA